MAELVGAVLYSMALDARSVQVELSHHPFLSETLFRQFLINSHDQHALINHAASRV